MGKSEGMKRAIGLKKYQRMPSIGNRAIFDGEPLERCTRGSAEATPRARTHESIVLPVGLPERIQIPLDLCRLRDKMAKERRILFGEAIVHPGCTQSMYEGRAERIDSWSIEFASESLSDGRQFRALTIVDNFTRESLANRCRSGHQGRHRAYL